MRYATGCASARLEAGGRWRRRSGDILTTAVRESEPSADLFNTLLERFTALGGVDLAVPARKMPARAADFPT
jgi:hypothetical protein